MATDTEETKLAKLKLEICKLTGRTPASSNATYLAARLADLRAAKKAGDDVKKTYAEPHAILNASMTMSQLAATKQMAADLGVPVSGLVRLAVGHFAKLRKHAKAMAAFGED